MPRGSRPGPNRNNANRGRRGGGAATASRGPFVPRPRVPEEPLVKAVQLPQTLTVRQLADTLNVSPVEIIKELMKNGVLASINQIVDYTTAAVVAGDLGFEPSEAKAVEVEIAGGPNELKSRRMREDDPSLLETRPPVVTIMGHVDHGKTSLLDAIRSANVTASEFGGITQHIGAYQVELDGRKITFLDTPGHEAFTAMRARGAQVTDIAIIVVAADDGVMPQTVEAINHAKAAGVPIVVAINKIDKEGANAERVKRELTEYELVVEEWGGDTIAVEVSAKSKVGIPDLLENLLIVAEVQDLKGNPHRRAEGVVIEANLDTSRGPMATVLVHNGTLKVGDTIVAGTTSGRVKAMFNDRGKPIKKAEPSSPAKILGLSAVPSAGNLLTGFTDDKSARAYLESRKTSTDDTANAAPITLLDLNARMLAGQIKELNLVLKTDVHGSIEPIRQSLEKLGNENLRVKLLHLASGTITESDVMLALASKGIVIGFNTRPEPGALRLAEQEGVEVRQYNVIYQLVEDIEKALTGLLEPTYVDVIDGHAEVRQVFKLGKRDQVAGSYMRDGKVTRNLMVKVLRGRDVLAESVKIESLKRLKDDAREVLAGYECGIVLDGFNDFQEGDVMEFFHKERQ